MKEMDVQLRKKGLVFMNVGDFKISRACNSLSTLGLCTQHTSYQRQDIL